MIRALSKIADLVVFIGIIWFSGFCLFNRKINSYPLDYTTKTDAIVALTGGTNRIFESIKILNEGLSDKLFISGVSEKTTIKDIQKAAKIQALDESKITLGKKAHNTIENASEAFEWIKDNDVEYIRLVTSYYHIPRSLQEFKLYGLRKKILPHPVYSQNVPREWWKNWGTFKLIASEYNKYAVVYIRNIFIY